MQSIRIVLTIVSSLCCGALPAQNTYSQENAEREATKRYETENTAPTERKQPAKMENEALYGARLTRTATLLATSCNDYRQPVNILIYGQSIVGSAVFTEELTNQINEKFPYADVNVENRAIGGFGGARIIRTAWHDLYPVYPDLVVFHVYGGERLGELEQLFSNIRRYTTADIILMNHHLDNGREKINETSFNYLRFIANKYDCELIDISTAWVQYLADNNLDKKELLRDNTHPNGVGSWLLANLIVRHIVYNPLFPSQWYRNVQTVYTSTAYNAGGEGSMSFSGRPWETTNNIPVGKDPDNPLKFTFHGNRIDIVAGFTDTSARGSARIKIDGKALSEGDGPHAITRPSRGAGGWWPAIMHIGHLKPLQQEDWTLHIDRVNADSTVYHYSVRGSKTGHDGSGNTSERFVSNSQRVVIEPSDWMFAEIKKTFKVVMEVGFEITWSVVPQYEETYRTPVISDRTKVYKTTVAKGLTNGPHTIEIIPNGDGEVPILAFEVHRPPLE